MAKRIAVAFTAVLVIIFCCFEAFLIYGKHALGSRHEFSFDDKDLYHSFASEGKMDVDSLVADSDYILEIQPTGQREKYEKNVLLEAKVLNCYKGSTISNQTIRIAEPIFGLTFYDKYIPLSEDKKYVVFLKECDDFSFVSYKFTSTRIPYIVRGNAVFIDDSVENISVNKMMETYDYFESSKDEYDILLDWVNKNCS